MIGRRVAQYEIRESLGGGGMGVVYKAWDTKLDRFVALKFLPPAVGSDASRRKRFVREAKAASAVEHPNVCTIYEIGETEDGQLFICMAYCEGRSLKEELERRPIDPAEALRIGLQILSGLDRAHAAGVVHRDLKPANVMVAPDGSVKLVDFGLAKVAHEEGLTEVGTSMGTVGYMSPEQVRGEEAGPTSDLWAVGVILWEMLTGRPPFCGSNAASALQAILNDPPKPVGALGARVASEVGVAVAKLLAKDPRDRFQSASETLVALGAVPGRPSSESESMLETAVAVPAASGASRRRWRRQRYVFALVAVLAVSAISVYVMKPAPPSAASRLAVLPFQNFTGDAAKSYLSDGLAAGLITSLSELQGLQVLSRREAWSQRDRELGSIELAHRLGVEILLEGALRQDGDDLVVDVDLLDADGAVVFSQEYRGSVEKAMELEKQISRRLTDILEIPLNRRERSRLSELPTTSFQAFDLYLRGQQELDRARTTTSGSSLGDADAAEAAVTLFDQAIRLDPDFALAYAGLSEANWQIGQRDRESEPLIDAREAAERALEIDPDLPAALVAVARLTRSAGNPADAIAGLQTALERHPHPDEAQRELGLSHEAANDLKAAESAFRGATLVGGEDWFNWNALGAFFWRLGRYDEAQTVFERAATLAPAGVVRPLENLATLEVSRGRFDAAIAAFDAIEGPVRSAILASNIGTAYYFSERPGHLEKAGEYYRLAVRLNPRDDDVQRNLADLLLRLGQNDEAHEHYRTARSLVESQLETDPNSHELRLRRAFYAAKAAECDLVRDVMLRLRSQLPDTAQNAHRSAYVFALCDLPEEALAELRRAIELGVSPDLIRGEDEFSSLRDSPEFRSLVGKPASS